MFSYQALDRVADAYNPLLGVAWLIVSVYPLFDRRWRVAGIRIGLGLAALLIAYGLMWLDSALSLWASLGLDYSTHTAVSLALAMSTVIIFPASRLPVAVSLLGYFGLMLYQRYHTPLDIISTSLVLCGPLVLLTILYRRLALRH